MTGPIRSAAEQHQSHLQTKLLGFHERSSSLLLLTPPARMFKHGTIIIQKICIQIILGKMIDSLYDLLTRPPQFQCPNTSHNTPNSLAASPRRDQTRPSRNHLMPVESPPNLNSHLELVALNGMYFPGSN